MATTREQAEAYGYASRRMTTSFLQGADEGRLDPRRRLNRATASGIAMAVLIMAGFGIAGWLGGGQGPELPGSGAVVAGDNGDRYLVVDGVVHPALNLASALLAGGGAVTEVRQAVVDEAPHGLPVGIPGAPDALPDAGDLSDAEWTLCAVPSETGGDPTTTALYVSVPGLAPDADRAPAVLAQTEDDHLWLLADGRRYALEATVRDRLGLPTAPVRLPAHVLATVPEAPAITSPQLDGAGREPDVPLPFDAAVGDVAHSDEGPTAQYFLVRADGLVAVSELEYALLTTSAGADHEIDATQAAQAPRSADTTRPGDPAWPETLPAPVALERDQPLCVSTTPGDRRGDTPWRATVHLPTDLPQPPGLTPIEPTEAGRLGPLDRVYLPHGSGALVRSATSAGSAGTHTLVTSGGLAYPVASADAVRRLGYPPEDIPALPSAFVDLLPAGPLLDPEAAAEEQHGAAPAEQEDDPEEEEQ